MHAFIILSLAGLAMALLPPSTGNITVTPEQIHANIMRNMPADRIVTSNSLTDYLNANLGANHTIYISDVGRFINMASVEPALTTRDDDRGAPPTCINFQKYWAEQIQHWWKPWVPVSSCQYTEFDPDGGSFSLNWGFSLSIEENAG
jgi:hypothetical protein